MEKGIEQLPDAEAFVRSGWDEIVTPKLASVDLSRATDVLDTTIAALNGSERVFHNLDYVADCLAQLKPYEGCEQYTEMWLALLWHKITCIPGSTQNGFLSAAYAKEQIKKMNLIGKVRLEPLAVLIEAAENQRPRLERESLLCDITKSIQAADPDTYGWYTEAIYKEQVGSGAQTHESYVRARMQFLRSYTGAFYHPDFMWMNDPAERNARAELAVLEETGLPNEPVIQ